MEFGYFQNLADFTHLLAKFILLWAIHRNRSAEGVSLLTQILYLMVFVTRYLDLFRAQAWREDYLVFFKIFFMVSSLYTIFLMMKVYPRTRERERAWKMSLGSVVGSLVLSPIVIPIFGKFDTRWFEHLMWTFSRILESVCVLPQLLLLRQTTVPTVINSYYLLALGLYRGFYILNWIVKAFKLKPVDPIIVIFGLIQTIFYIDFAWVYYTRQRVKLRNGAVVDSDDFHNSWILNKLFTIRQRRSEDDEEQRLQGGGSDDGQGNNEQRPTNNRWGARGISISADDTLENHHDRDVDGFSEEEFEDHTPDQGARRHSPATAGRRD